MEKLGQRTLSVNIMRDLNIQKLSMNLLEKCSYQKNKTTRYRNYDQLPLTTAEQDKPCTDVHVDMIIPWIVKVFNEDTLNTYM